MQSILKIYRYLNLLKIQRFKKHSVRKLSSNGNFQKLFPDKNEFQSRHIGPRDFDQLEMLKTIGFNVNLILIKNKIFIFNYFICFVFSHLKN